MMEVLGSFIHTSPESIKAQFPGSVFQYQCNEDLSIHFQGILNFMASDKIKSFT